MELKKSKEGYTLMDKKERIADVSIGKVTGRLIITFSTLYKSKISIENDNGVMQIIVDRK